MSFYKTSAPVKTLKTFPEPNVTKIVPIQTVPGYETNLLKEQRLQKTSIPTQPQNLTNDYNELGLIHQANVYAASVGTIIQGKSDSEVDKIIRVTRDYSGHILPDLSPLGDRVENDIERKTGLDGRLYFWERGGSV